MCGGKGKAGSANAAAVETPYSTRPDQPVFFCVAGFVRTCVCTNRCALILSYSFVANYLLCENLSSLGFSMFVTVRIEL